MEYLDLPDSLLVSLNLFSIVEMTDTVYVKNMPCINAIPQ